MSDEVELEVDGRVFTGWTRVRCRRSLEAVAGKFDLVVADRPGFPVRVGSQVVLSIDGDALVTGHVDRLQKSLRTREVNLEGRDRTGDLVDCSAVSPPYEFSDEGLSAIAAKLCDPFGIGVVLTHDEGDPFPRFAIHPGETVFEAIERGARLRGLLATTDGLGRLILQRPIGVDSGVALREGENILDATIDLDDSQRFRDYLVLAQDLAKDPNAIELPEGIAFDLGAREGRSLLVVAEGALDADDCQDRAEWEAASRSAKAATVTVSVQGAHVGEDLGLWRPGLLVLVEAPTLRLEARLLVGEVSITQDKTAGGTRSELVLVRPDAYVLETEKPRKKDLEAEWGSEVDDEEASGEE